MIDCPHCGNQLPDGAAFCNQCWRTLDSPVAAAPVPEAAPFAPADPPTMAVGDQTAGDQTAWDQPTTPAPAPPPAFPAGGPVEPLGEPSAPPVFSPPLGAPSGSAAPPADPYPPTPPEQPPTPWTTGAQAPSAPPAPAPYAGFPGAGPSHGAPGQYAAAPSAVPPAPSPGAAPGGYAPYAAPGYGQPGYGPAGYGQPGYYAPYPVSNGTNGMAIASLVCSIAAVVVACGLTAPLGIIFGHIALSQLKTDGKDGRGLAVAGLWIGYIVTALLVLGIIFVVAVSATGTST